MKLLPIWLILFGTILIIFPDLVGYILWGLLIFLWINSLIFMKVLFGKKSSDKEDYVQFGKYKIYK